MTKIDYKEKYKSYKWANKWSNFIVDKPYKALALFVLAALIMMPGIFSITSKWSPRIWFDEDHPQIQKLNQFESQFGSDTFISLGVYHPDGVFQEKILKSIYEITEKNVDS